MPLEGRHFLVIGRYIAHAKARNGLVAPVHFMHGPVQGIFGIGHFRNNRMHQMGHICVQGHLDTFGINKQKTRVFWFEPVKQTDQNTVEADAFAGACRASHQQMGHSG